MPPVAMQHDGIRQQAGKKIEPSVTPRAAMITARTSSNGNGHELNQIRLLFRLALALRFGKWI